MSIRLYPASFDAALFDFDGTLSITQPIWKKIDREFLGARGIEMPDDYQKIVNVLGFEAGAAYTIERFGLSETVEEVKSIWAKTAREAYKRDCKLRAGAKEYIEYLKKNGVLVGLVTTGAPEMLQDLEQVDVAALFDEQIYVHEVGRSKEFPDIYLEAAKRLHADINKTIVFEDIVPGINSAKSAGFLTCAINNRDDKQEKEQLKDLADFWIDEFTDIGFE